MKEAISYSCEATRVEHDQASTKYETSIAGSVFLREAGGTSRSE